MLALSGDALEQAAQEDYGVTIPGAFQEKGECGTQISGYGAGGLMVGLDDLNGLAQS